MEQHLSILVWANRYEIQKASFCKLYVCYLFISASSLKFYLTWKGDMCNFFFPPFSFHILRIFYPFFPFFLPAYIPWSFDHEKYEAEKVSDAEEKNVDKAIDEEVF